MSAPSSFEDNKSSLDMILTDDELHAATQTDYNRLSNETLPVYSLPIELLCAIFQFGYLSCSGVVDSDSDSDTESDYSISSPTSFEVTISHVSSHWRGVAIRQAHFLWSHVVVHPTSSLHRVHEYISRSGERGLDVSINLANAQIDAQIIDAVVSAVRRWRRCCIDCSFEDMEHPVVLRLCQLELSAPQIEHLSLSVGHYHCHYHPFPRDMTMPQIFRGSCTRLAFVRLRGVAMYFFRPSLASVTTLHLDKTSHVVIPYTQFKQLLSNAPCLANLSIYGNIIELETFPPDDAIFILSLRSLRVCALSGSMYSTLLLCIVAPNLHSLLLKNMQEHDLDAFFASPCSHGKFPHLASLTFHSFDLIGRTFEKFFDCFPGIESFTTINSLPPNILSVKTTQGSRTPWASLHTLTLILNFDAEHLIKDWMQRRLNSGYPISHLRLISYNQQLSDLHDYKWLREHVALESLCHPDRWPVDMTDNDVDDDVFMNR